MGSDLWMESRNNPAPCPKASDAVKALEEAHAELQTRFSAVVAEKSRLEAQARQDADTIVRLTREREGWCQQALDGVDVN
jgi:hypothetical protein